MLVGHRHLDLLIFPLLALALGAIVAYLAATPPTRLAFGVADPPAEASFRNF